MNEKFLGKIRRPQVYNDHARDIIWGEGCNAQNIIYGFRCTRVKGHLGPHEARGLHNNSFMIWW